MKNCLVTKLKGTVDNATLPYLGAIKIELKGNSYIHFQNFGFKAKIQGDGYFTSSTSYNDNLGKEIDKQNSGSIYIKTDGCFLYIFDDYKFDYISATSQTPIVLDINDFKYRQNLTSIDVIGNESSGDISSFKECVNTIRICLYGFPNITGDIKNLAGLTKAENIQLFKTSITGNVETLTNLVSLNTLYLSYSNITGSAEKLLEGLLKNGKTGNLNLGVQESNATFNGNTISGDKNLVCTFNNSSIVCNWSTGGHAATYNGTSWSYS